MLDDPTERAPDLAERMKAENAAKEQAHMFSDANFSLTNLVAYLKILLVVVVMGLVLLGRMDTSTALTTVVGLGALLSAAGFKAAADQDAPVTVQSTTIRPAHGDTPATVETSVMPPTDSKAQDDK